MPSSSCTRALSRTPLFAVLALGLASGMASAQSDAERASVRFTVDGCPALSPERVRAILGAELGALLIDASADATTPAIETVVACEGIVANLTVRDPASGTVLVRRVELDIVHPAARERLVALTIAELVTALGIELDPPASEPAPGSEPVHIAPATEPGESADAAVESHVDPPRRLRLSALGTATVLGNPRRGAFGGRVRIDGRLHERLGWAAALSADRGHVTTALGDVSHVALSLDVEATFDTDIRATTIQGAVGLRIGAAFFRGDASVPDVGSHVFRAPVLAPLVAVRASYRPSGRMFVVFGTELSVYLVSAHALVDGVRAASFHGASFGAELGIGFEL